MGRDVGRQCALLRRRQFARPVAATRAGAYLAGAPPPDQRLVDVRHTDPKNRCCRPRRDPAVDSRQNARSQILRIAPSPPPSHHTPHILRSGDRITPWFVDEALFAILPNPAML